MAPSPPSICIFCFGNSARGDDALGEHLHARLQQKLARHPERYGNLQLVLDFQLAPEHIFDLHSADIGIFIDAHENADSGVQWQAVTTGSQLHFSSHHLPPESLLFLYEETFEKPAPRCYLLSMGGEVFELGAGLSTTAQAHLDQAEILLEEKLQALATQDKRLSSSACLR